MQANGAQAAAADAHRQLLTRDAVNDQVHGADQRPEHQQPPKMGSLGSGAASDSDGTPPVCAGCICIQTELACLQCAADGFPSVPRRAGGKPLSAHHFNLLSKLYDSLSYSLSG